MESKKNEKLKKSLKQLKQSINYYLREAEAPSEIRFYALAKAFEVTVEYAWKELKRRVEDDGLEAPSPKEAVRVAARIGLIEDAKQWIGFINARNDGVHDYFEVPEEDYVAMAKNLLKDCKKII